MKNRLKRLMAATLAGTMLLSSFPTSAFAAEGNLQEIESEESMTLLDAESSEDEVTEEAAEEPEEAPEEDIYEEMPEDTEDQEEESVEDYEMEEDPSWEESDIDEEEETSEEEFGEEETFEAEEITIEEEFTLQDVVDQAVLTNEEAEEAETRILSVTMKDQSAIVTYVSKNDASVSVYLADEDDAEETHLAEGKAEVTSTKDRELASDEIEIPLTLLDLEEMPSNFVIVAEISDGEEEYFKFVSDEYTRFRQGIDKNGLSFLKDYAAGHNVYGTEDNYVVYSDHVVVISAEETKALEIEKAGSVYTLKPAPTQIRNMTEEEVSQIVGIVFIQPDGEHKVVKIIPGSMELKEEEKIPVVSFEAEVLDYGSTSMDDLEGLFKTIHLSGDASQHMSQSINDEFATGQIDLDVTGTGMVDVTYEVLNTLIKVDLNVDYSAASDIQVKRPMIQVKPGVFNDGTLEAYYLDAAQKYELGTLNFKTDTDGVLASSFNLHIKFTANLAASGPIETSFVNKGSMKLDLKTDYYSGTDKTAEVNTSTEYSKLNPIGSDYQTDFCFAISTNIDSDKLGGHRPITGSTNHISKVICYNNPDENSYNGVEVKHYCGIAEDGGCISYGIADKATMNIEVV